MKSPCFLLTLVCALCLPAHAAPGRTLPGGMPSATPNQVATDADLLTCRQENGEMRRDAASNGSPLTIAAQTFEKGIGTRATSMLPVTIPAGARFLQGACGIDDTTGNAGGRVEFRILSGSSILWKSPAMNKGMKAAPFRVACPEGATKLYLVARSSGNAQIDADWVNLQWVMEGSSAQTAATADKTDKPLVWKAEQFGLKPGQKDATEAMSRLLEKARAQKAPVTIVLGKGRYHFHAPEALEMSFYVSNHDQPGIRPVGVPLVDLDDVTIDGQGSTFVFHGKMQPVLLMDSSNVSLSNITIALSRAWGAEVEIVANGNGSTEVAIDEKRYPYEVRGNKFVNIGEGWEQGIGSAMAFTKEGLHIAPNTADMGMNPDIEVKSPGRLVLKNWETKNRGLKPGDHLVLRSYARPHPAMVIYRCSNVLLKNVVFQDSMGMALLAQRSENIAIDGGGCVVAPGRVHTAGADACHFSNTKGLVKVENALYEGMMDDSINVHATSLGIESIPAPDTLVCAYKHGQAIGFEVVLPGERLRLISGPTLENGAIRTVRSVRKTDSRHLEIKLDKPVPAGIGVGDAVENADWHPSVIFRNNTVRNNRARGTLFTTPRPVLVENNTFDHSSGSAILLAGDAQGWYESGACENVIIRNNNFIHNLTSHYQFTEAVISIFPMVNKLADQKNYYHKNVSITGNNFVTQDVPLLFAISTENLDFTRNKVHYDDKYRSEGKKTFIFQRCRNINIRNNKTNRPAWKPEDCQLDALTPASEVHVSGNAGKR